jgi:hypothetical protein
MQWYTQKEKNRYQDLTQGIYLHKLKYFPKEKEKWNELYEAF